MNQFPSLTVADKLALTLDGLARAVAARSGRGPTWLEGLAPLAGLLIRLVWTRVKRTETRILRLLALFQAGRLVVRSPAGPAAVTGRARGGACGGAAKGMPQRAEGNLPRRFGWLLPLVPCEAANYAAQLRLWLAEPEMVALLASSAQARRVLAPLCRMLGIDAAMLTPPGA